MRVTETIEFSLERIASRPPMSSIKCSSTLLSSGWEPLEGQLGWSPCRRRSRPSTRFGPFKGRGTEYADGDARRAAPISCADDREFGQGHGLLRPEARTVRPFSPAPTANP